MTVNHDVVGSSPTGGVSTRKGFLFFSFLKFNNEKMKKGSHGTFLVFKESVV